MFEFKFKICNFIRLHIHLVRYIEVCFLLYGIIEKMQNLAEFHTGITEDWSCIHQFHGIPAKFIKFKLFRGTGVAFDTIYQTFRYQFMIKYDYKELLQLLIFFINEKTVLLFSIYRPGTRSFKHSLLDDLNNYFFKNLSISLSVLVNE